MAPSFDPLVARKYVQGLDLAGIRRGFVTLAGEDDAKTVFDEAKRQAQAAGSGLFAFENGVTPAVREAISDAALLAQLVAGKRVDAERDPLGWFKAYSEVLMNVGWTATGAGWVDYSARGTSVQVHEKILEVATTAFAGSPALTLVTASVNALRGMDPKNPWFTVFNRESQMGKIARFQIGFVSTDENREVLVQMLACLIQASSNVTQVLFFKWKDARASFRANDLKITVNRSSMTELSDAIRTKTRVYQQDYLSSILDM